MSNGHMPSSNEPTYLSDSVVALTYKALGLKNSVGIDIRSTMQRQWGGEHIHVQYIVKG